MVTLHFPGCIREVARCFHGYRNYAPHSDITRYQNLCTIPSSSRICIQIPLAYPALPNWHFQILPLYYKAVYNNNVRSKEDVRNLRMFDGLVFQLEHPNTTKFMNTPIYKGGELWNRLPAELRNIKDIDEFKKAVKDIV